MNTENQAMDEYTLAAFMAGTLSPVRREEVALYLSHNPDARELLQMAYEALEASQAKDENFDLPVPEEARPAIKRADRQPSLTGRRMHLSIARFVAAAVVVFSVGMGLRVALGPPTDALRSRPADDVLVLSVEAEAGGPIVAWNEIPDAFQYKVVVWDPDAAEVVGRHETALNRLDDSDPFYRGVRARALPGRSYTVRVDAYDAQNRLILTSESIPVTLAD